MSLSIKYLSKNIQMNTKGIIWLTDEELNLKTPGIYEFNYLLNGILVKSLNPSSKNDSQLNHYFLGETFGNPFFIGHVVIKDKKHLKTIEEHIDISKKFFNDDTKIFIYNKSQNTANINVLKTMSEKYHQIQFENLNI